MCVGPLAPPSASALPPPPEAIKDPTQTLQNAMQKQTSMLADASGAGLDNTVKTGGQGTVAGGQPIKTLLGQ